MKLRFGGGMSRAFLQRGYTFRFGLRGTLTAHRKYNAPSVVDSPFPFMGARGRGMEVV